MPKKAPKLSRTRAPDDLTPLEWQRGLRRQFGREQDFGLENLTPEPFFSEFRVSNRASKSAYRVAIRGPGPGGNFCSCPDYGTSELASANGDAATSHPWIERDAATGAQSLKIPLPPPAIAKQLAGALSALADTLRRGAG